MHSTVHSAMQCNFYRDHSKRNTNKVYFYTIHLYFGVLYTIHTVHSRYHTFCVLYRKVHRLNCSVHRTCGKNVKCTTSPTPVRVAISIYYVKEREYNLIIFIHFHNTLYTVGKHCGIYLNSMVNHWWHRYKIIKADNVRRKGRKKVFVNLFLLYYTVYVMNPGRSCCKKVNNFFNKTILALKRAGFVYWSSA